MSDLSSLLVVDTLQFRASSDSVTQSATIGTASKVSKDLKQNVLKFSHGRE